MNEVGVIRNQLVLERTHARAVAHACASTMQDDTTAIASGRSLAQFRRACVDYLACVLAWFEERDQRLADLLQTDLRATDWRSFGGIDADSILEERRRYAQVCAQVPPGVALGTSPQ